MYNLIIIDDEILTINMIKDYINWNDYKFNLVKCFSVAADALEYVNNNLVHAVITDINMPDMDGLELADKIKKLRPNTAIGFISAHRNFDYALTAANMNCCGYILKPIMRKELRSLCKKLYEYVDECDRKEALSNHSSIDYNKLEFESFEIKLECQAIMADILYGVLTNQEEIDKKFQHSGIDILCECYSSIIEICLVDFQNYTSHVWKHNLILLYNSICTLVSYNNASIKTLPIAYYENRLLVLAVAKKGCNHIFREKLAQVTDIITQNLNDILKISQIDIVSTSIFNNLTEITNFTNTKSNLNFTGNNSLMKEIIAYTNKNYANISSINTVAEHFHFSPIYFGRYFQKNANKTFNVYLNELKIEKAKELLLGSNMKLSAIALSIGFKNESYFYTVFKNITGQTPNQFRDSNNTLLN